MKTAFLTILPILYQSIALIALIGYMPQIFSLLRSKTRSLDISLSAWWVWFTTYIISILYGVIFLNDLRFLIIMIVNLVCCIVIIAVTTYNRYFRFRKK